MPNKTHFYGVEWLKTYFGLKRLNIGEETQFKLVTYLISIGMLLITHLNDKTAFSPRMIKSFIRVMYKKAKRKETLFK